MAYRNTVFFALSFITVICKIQARLLFSANPVNLTENRPPNEAIATADDRLIPDPGVYVISGSPDEFQINAMSGVIKSKKTFNYETDPRRYELVVESRNPSDQPVARAILVVNILNEEEAPECLDTEFAAGKGTISIDENFPMFNPIYKVEAKDEDIGDILTYTLESESSGPTAGGKFFSVESTNGVVSRTSADPLDFEEGYHEFQLIIRVTDRSKLFCEGTLTIRINDVNDEPPIFETFPGDTIEVSERTLVGTNIATVKATDKDAGSQISYSFAVPQTVFALNSDTGDITLLKSLQIDKPDNLKNYPLWIEASDNANTHTARYRITIVVISEDVPPVCDPGFSTGAGISLFVIETYPPKKAVYVVLARDPDAGDDVKFELLKSSEDTEMYFNLDEDSGVISTTDVALDFEKDPKTFQMTVSATDKKADPKSCTGTITFIILNANDEAPVFQNIPSERIAIPEHLPAGTPILTLQAIDQDIDDRVYYEFVNVYKGFSIDEDTGEIKISFPLDYEDRSLPPRRVLRIRAYDNDRVHSVVAQLTIALLDLNDNAPKCENYLFVIQLAETTPIDTHLLELKCEDADVLDPNNALRYAMDLDDYSIDKFKLTGNDITLGPKGLDYDSLIFSGMQFKHTLIIRVSDQGVPSLTSTVTVILRVTRVNEFSPVPGNNVFTVLENSAVDTLVGTVKFTDGDWPFNNLKYTVVGGDFGTPPKFYIEPNTGNIKVLQALDREVQPQYTASIQATDLKNDIEPDPLKQLKHIALVTINIQNVNDEPPVCNPAYYEKTIYSTVKTPFLELECSDKDSPNNQLNYAIIGGNDNNRFTLQRTGDDPPSLATRQNFQYNVFEGIQDPTVFQLLIEVTDEFGGSKASQLTTTATVIVHVVPWTTTVPTTPTTATKKASMTTSVLVRIAYVWNPDNWFPAVLAITGVLLLLCIYALAWGILKDVPKYSKLFPRCQGCKKKPQFNTVETANNGPRNSEPTDTQLKSEEKPTVLPGNSLPSTIFDGRAVDLATGAHYLFNSKTGEVQWLN